MALLLFEALLALTLLLFIVWWTMFSGRREGERDGSASTDAAEPRSRPDD
jgi:cbb3-type cytochrome oxidase subunit 3